MTDGVEENKGLAWNSSRKKSSGTLARKISVQKTGTRSEQF